MAKRPFVSIVVPTVLIDSSIVKDLIPALMRQSYIQFELILIPDALDKDISLPAFVRVFPKKNSPAHKRDYGVSLALGSIIVFIDADAYPCENDWLRLIVKNIQAREVAAVCGPGLTPLRSNLSRQLSGYVWSSLIGAGGAGIYRNKPLKTREVDDYPTFNLAVKKTDFLLAGGFNTKYWPGEDTVLCHEIVYKLHKKIIYFPEIKVFHHRRPLLRPHLLQVSRYGLHRGYFSKILPRTSRRLGYYAPVALVVYLILLMAILPDTGASSLVAVPLYIYLLLLTAAAVSLLIKTRNIMAALLLPGSIFITHCVYGIMFFKGMLVTNLKN